MKYEGVATLGVNLNRQKYGPLDVSSVLLNMDDLNAYCAKDKDAMSEGWTGGTPYPYPGQIIVVLSNNTAYQLREEADGSIKPYAMIDLSQFYTTTQIDEMLQKISVDMSDYYTKEQIDALLKSLEGSNDNSTVESMSEDEILAIIGSISGGTPVNPNGQVLAEMTAKDVRNIIYNS